MPEQTIQSHDRKLHDVFQGFYAVPAYQREYVWEADQVEQLLTDIHTEMSGSDSTKAPEYFIGSIVVCPGESGLFDLIDGQQRITTLFLALCAIRDRFEELGLAVPGALAGQIAATSTDATGHDHFRYRIELQYDDSGDVLERIATRQANDISPATRSITNILNAYRSVGVFLRREFEANEDALRGYYGYLINKVKLIRIETEDVAKALKIFETINDRGIGLDAMDLLKNLLFMKADREQFERLKNLWKELQDTIYGAGEKPLRFLRYFIFSRYDVEVLREDQIYTWFSKNDEQIGYSRSPLDFAQELLRAAKDYAHFLNGKDASGSTNRYLENLRLLGGRAARQHLILLLAGRHLPAQLFDQLAKEVEELFFVYVVTREATRDFERNFARWAIKLRSVRSAEELERFVQDHFRPAKQTLAARFNDAFGRLAYGDVQQYRLRYILAKLTQHVELRAYGETTGTKPLSNYTSAEYEIEHIFPSVPSSEAQAEFGESRDPEIASRLGNLVLVERSINASLGNRPYSHKRDVYPKSKLLLTRCLAKSPQIGRNTRIDAAVAGLEQFPEWNGEAVDRRQQMLRRLACEAWNVVLTEAEEE